MPAKIALFVHDRRNDYQQLVVSDAEAAARRHHLLLQVESADLDAERQIDQVRAAVTAPEAVRPALILVSAVREFSLLPLVHDAARAGIGFVFLSRWNEAIHDFRRRYSDVPIYCVSANQRQIGKLQGQQVRRVLRPGMELVSVEGPLGTSSVKFRAEGLAQETQSLGVSTQSFHADWSERGAETVVKNWLGIFQGPHHMPEIVVAAQNDNMAMGARRALSAWCHQHGAADFLGRTPILGVDGSRHMGQSLVRAGDLAATIIVPPVSGRAIDEFVAFTLGRGMPRAEILLDVTSFPELYEIHTPAAEEKGAQA